MNRDILLNMIGLYLAKVKYIHELFEKEYGICNPLRAYRARVLQQEGYLDKDKTIKFMFHGIGCKISFMKNGLIIDFDYGPDMRIDGFDLWRISKFIESQKKFREEDINNVEDTFNFLEEEGLIIGPKKHNLDSKLYFFPSVI